MGEQKHVVVDGENISEATDLIKCRSGGRWDKWCWWADEMMCIVGNHFSKAVVVSGTEGKRVWECSNNETVEMAGWKKA